MYSAGPANYPSGFTTGITIRNVPVSITHPGKVFWVNNSSVLAQGGIGGSNGNDGTYQRPFSTLDYAIGRCTAGRGDVIYIMPGHAESLTAADGVDVDVADVRIIGLGRGLKRAKFTYDNSAGEFVIGAANVRIENLWFVPSVTGITKAIDVEAAGDHFEIVGCRFADAEAAGTDEFLDCILVAAGADNGVIQGCYVDMGEAGATNFVTYTTAIGQQMYDNFITGDFSTAVISFVTTASVGFIAIGNLIRNGVNSGLNTEPIVENLANGEMLLANNRFGSDVATAIAMFTNWDRGGNYLNYYTDDSSGASTAVDRTASITVMADG